MRVIRVYRDENHVNAILRVNLRAALAPLACALIAAPAGARTLQLACESKLYTPVSFVIDYEQRTVTEVLFGTLYTVAAVFTDQTISWSNAVPKTADHPAFAHTWTLHRVTGWLRVDEPAHAAWTCHEASKKF